MFVVWLSMINIGCIVTIWNGWWNLADLPMGRVSIGVATLDEEMANGAGNQIK